MLQYSQKKNRNPQANEGKVLQTAAQCSPLRTALRGLVFVTAVVLQRNGSHVTNRGEWSLPAKGNRKTGFRKPEKGQKTAIWPICVQKIKANVGNLSGFVVFLSEEPPDSP